MQLSIVAKTLGLLLMVFSLAQVPPVLVDLIYSEGEYLTFVFSFILTVFGGLVLWWPFRAIKKSFRLREGVLIVVSFWIVLSLFGTLPFLITESISNLSFSNAFFESMSGLTTTGATVLSQLDELPKSILFYRQQLQWLGGMGIIVLAVAVLPLLGVGGMELYHAESSGIAKDRLTPKLRNTAIALWKIYLSLTVLCALAYFFSGMSIFDAISHSFSTVAIGGFSTHDGSIGYFNSIPIEMIAMFFMFLAGINFSLHFVAWNNRSLVDYIKDSEFKTYAMVLLSASAIVVIALSLNSEYGSTSETIRHSLFQTISIATTTGFTSQNYSNWPAAIPVFLIMVSFIGACVGSTGGGIKVVRVLVMFRLGMKEIHKFIRPNAQVSIKLNKASINEKALVSVLGFFSLYAISFIFIMMLLMFAGLDQVTAYSATAATMNNLGPGLGEVAQNYGSLGETAKWILSFSMLIGRLEVLTIIAIFHRAFWRH
ncbi:MAG: potassium transporter [Gammaproteobacteria bacterium]|jgi:trk system potassium uptake protein TrkH|nr:potassium transporter [Gammaproteobacteria bacterium]MBT4974778.1 potassium transporter [Gammaproteobacteria bacterium]MBT8009527.1 potassium transporter [Gammaproteobacteria bacterium]